MLDHKMRQLAIGGSDIGAVMGLDADRDGFAVWASKRGGLRRLTDEEKPLAMLLGTCLEEGIIKFYSYYTGRSAIFDNKTRRHPDRPYMVYTPDALCQHERRGIDAKHVRGDQWRKWGETLEEIPPRVVAQAWWYMAAMDYDKWDIFAIIGGDPRLYTIERDLEIERVMLEKAEEFWRRYLVGDEQPPIGYSDEAQRWLKQKFPMHKTPLLEAGDAEAALLDEYSLVRVREEDAADDRMRLEVQIKAAIKDAEGIRWPHGHITYRSAKPTTKIDWESLAMNQMTLLGKKEQDLIIQEYSVEKPGSRRFLWTFEEPIVEVELAPGPVLIEGAVALP